MSDAAATAEAVHAERSWNGRVQLIRRIPENFGVAQLQDVYAKVAERVYVPSIGPDFAYVHWRDEYELGAIVAAYDSAHALTEGFTRVGVEDLRRAISSEPATLDVFRLILGLLSKEFSSARATVAKERKLKANSPLASAITIDLAMRGELFPPPAPDTGLRVKLDKPDTADGWESVRRYAADGVPYSMLLHQRAYGGAFRQLLDATSSKRGDYLEDAVAALFADAQVPHIRTGSRNQAEIAKRFGLTVKPAPDFVIFDQGTDTLRAMLECKIANDGGTARDKAARFRSIRTEAQRLGGIPVLAVLSGLGWRRTGDALGPVVRDTDGRTFTMATLDEMLQCEPFPALLGTAVEVPAAAETAADYRKKPRKPRVS